MSSFGALWPGKTHACIRTARSIHSNTGPGQGHWLRLQETEHVAAELKRLHAQRAQHTHRRRLLRQARQEPTVQIAGSA